MNLASELDRAELRRRFFAACEDEFRRGAKVEKLVELSADRGVWDGAEEALARFGKQEIIKSYIRNAKDSDGRRKYHSIPTLDAEGGEVQIYKDVAFLELGDYKSLFAKYERRIQGHAAVYLDLINQAKERYGYQHPLPLEVQAYVDATVREDVADGAHV